MHCENQRQPMLTSEPSNLPILIPLQVILTTVENDPGRGDRTLDLGHDHAVLTGTQNFLVRHWSDGGPVFDDLRKTCPKRQAKRDCDASEPEELHAYKHLYADSRRIV